MKPWRLSRSRSLSDCKIERASPGLSVRGSGFSNPRECFGLQYRALALVSMLQAPQSTRTFFVSSTTVGRRALLQSDRMAQLLVDVLAENRRKQRLLLHEFVIMPNHFHLLLTCSGYTVGKGTTVHQGRFRLSCETGKLISHWKYGKEVS